MTTDTFVNIAAGLAIPLLTGVAGWMWRVEKHMARMRTLQQIPQKINKLDRRTLRILMKVDPLAAQEELKTEAGSIQTV